MFSGVIQNLEMEDPVWFPLIASEFIRCMFCIFFCASSCCHVPQSDFFFFETNLKVMWTHWFLIGSDKTFVTGDNEGYVIAWDAQSKKKLHEVTCDP